GLRRVQPAQDAQLLVGGQLLVGDLDPLLNPGALLGVLDVHVLDADGPAVGVPQDAQDLAQGQPGRPAEPTGGEAALQVPQGQAVVGDVQVVVLALAVLQRVGVGHQV